MADMPLIYTYQDTVHGNGFLAGITVSGRALAVREEDGWWMYGVQPGAIAEGGETLAEARAGFRASYQSYLFDITETAGSSDELSAEIHRFFDAVDEQAAQAWERAIDDIANDRVTLEPPFSKLPREPVGKRRAVCVRVERLDMAQPQKFSPNQNVLESIALAMAA
ncbi:MAG: hypothetical protein ACR2G6_17740 [Gemmatimonadaceae bacterium]